MGDSWADEEYLGNTLEENCASKETINVGVSGALASMWANGHECCGIPTWIRSPITHVYMSLGGNDYMDRNCGESAFPGIRRDLTDVIEKLRSQFGQNVAITMTGYGIPSRVLPMERNCNRDSFARFQLELASIASLNNVQFVDVSEWFLARPSDQWSSSTYFVDDIHLSRAGYNRMWRDPIFQNAFGCGNSGNPITTTRLPTTTTNSNSGSNTHKKLSSEFSEKRFLFFASLWEMNFPC